MITAADLLPARVRYQDGQILASDDLNDDLEHEASLRALHARYLHATWGIAKGFDVAVAPGGGGLRVGPGYAVDLLGQDLLLARPAVVQAPVAPIPESLVLVARRAATRGCSCGCGHPRGSGCAVTRTTDVAAPAAPELGWETPDEVRLGIVLPLASAVVQNGQVLGSPDPGVRRYARPMVAARVARGRTEPGSTGWRAWSETGHEGLGLEVHLDTSAAGFVHAPVYLAALSRAAHAHAPAIAWEDAAGWIASATADGFVYRVPQAGLLQLPPEPSEAEKQQWTVSWIALEGSHA